jgi:hypothetical protein
MNNIFANIIFVLQILPTHQQWLLSGVNVFKTIFLRHSMTWQNKLDRLPLASIISLV